MLVDVCRLCHTPSPPAKELALARCTSPRRRVGTPSSAATLSCSHVRRAVCLLAPAAAILRVGQLAAAPADATEKGRYARHQLNLVPMLCATREIVGLCMCVCVRACIVPCIMLIVIGICAVFDPEQGLKCLRSIMAPAPAANKVPGRAA